MKDAGVLSALSPALMGGAVTLTTNDKGQLRILALPPGLYALDVSRPTVLVDPRRVMLGAKLNFGR